MKTSDIKGIIPPVITPMNNDPEQTVNHEALRQQVERLLAGGVHGIFPMGTNGEAYALSFKEKEEILVTVIDQVKGRVPVYAGTGCITTAETIRLSKRAEELGADALSIITPSFALASQKELYDHYTAVAKAVNLPIILYNIPAALQLLPNVGHELRSLSRLGSQQHHLLVFRKNGTYIHRQTYHAQIILQEIITRHMKRLVGLDANGVTQLTYQFISLFQYNIRNACHGGRLYGSSVLLPDRGSHLIIIKAGAHALPRGTEPGRQLHAQKLVIGKENDFGSLGKHGQMQLLSIAVHA